MSRIGTALKAFVNYQNVTSDYEKQVLTVLENIGYGKTDLKKILEKGFNSNTYVYSIINRIAETASAVPIIVERKNQKGEWEEVTEGEFYDFVHRPNPKDNYKTHIYKSLVYQLATGNETIYGLRGIGSGHFSERYNLSPQYLTPKIKRTIIGAEAISWKYNYAGIDYNIEVEELSHLSKFNPDPSSENPIMGLSPLQAAYQTLVSANETQLAKASLIKNKGAFGLITNKGQRALSPEDADKLSKSLKKRIGGGENFGAVKVTSGDLSFVQLAMSPTDLKLLENATIDLRDLCSVFGVSSTMFNDPQGKTFNNVKVDDKKFYTQAVLPPLENHNDNFNSFFIPGWNERDNETYRTRILKDSIEALQENQAEAMNKAKTRSDVVTTILTGVGTLWSAESAVLQLMDALGMKEEDAKAMVGEKPVQQPITQPVL